MAGCSETEVQEQAQCSKAGSQDRKNTRVENPQLGRADGGPGERIKIHVHMWKTSGKDIHMPNKR